MVKTKEMNLSPTKITIPLTKQFVAQIPKESDILWRTLEANGTGSRRIGIENGSGKIIGSVCNLSLDGNNLVVEIYRLREVDDVKTHLRR